MPNPTVTTEVTVPLPPPAAFRLFIEQLDSWWPREYTWGQEALEWIGIEPHEGGRCTERGPNGFQCDWGQVTGWEPPRLVELAWQISPRREPVPDPGRASRVQVEFTGSGGESSSGSGDSGTLVRLQHDGFDRHGPEGGAYRDAMAAEQGWPLILGRYAAAAR